MPSWRRTARISKHKSDVALRTQQGAETGTLIIYLPGILAGGEDSSQSLIETWLDHGDVLTVSYTGGRFDAEDVVNTVVWSLKTAPKSYLQFVFVGSSMGGLLALDVIDRLRRDRSSVVAYSNLILIDSPSGSRDMMAGGNIAAPLMRLMPLPWLFNGIGGWLMSKMFMPPKDENIEGPKEGFAKIKSRALEMMGKFPFAVWRDQLAYMAAHSSPKAADFQGLRRIVYMRCDRNNETVRSQAAETWKRAAPELQVVGVDSTHCGFIERPSVWNRHFKELLGSMALMS